jgi:UDP:flavonoid glycosyltransferase YjiC (YdhE family)
VVYLSLGSSGISRLYEPILAALSEFGLPIVVATSGYELQGTLPRECYHAPYLPAHAILPHAILAITNGGSPSSYQAISHGVPVLGVPFNMDQLLCMEHLEKSGSALTLRVDTFSTFNLKRLSKEIIESTSYHLAACSQAKELQRYDATTEIEKIIHNLITRFRKCTNGFNSS